MTGATVLGAALSVTLHATLAEYPRTFRSRAASAMMGRHGRRARRRPAAVDPEEATMPQYLIAFNDEWVPDQTPDDLRRKSAASRAVLDDMRSAGVFVFADGGIDASTAVCSVVARDGRPHFTDGPYTDTAEHLGGFTVVDVPDDDAARHWAGRLAVVLEWPQEVHRFPAGVTEIIERER